MPELLSPHLRINLNNAFAQDWARQRITAEDVLRRLQSQEGVVLADQVGMGKTFVALAVATSVILGRPALRQVVVFVPARVASKWVNEWGKFSESLLVDVPEIRCVPVAIRSGEDFLKALDDPPERRNHLVVVTHEALTASLKDSFIQLALAHFATRRRNGAAAIRTRIVKWSLGRKGLIRDARLTPKLVERLLNADPGEWRSVCQQAGLEMDDDPVPGGLLDVAQDLELGKVWEALQALPVNWSAQLDARLRTAREALNEATQGVWKQVLARAKTQLPLIVVDEAHALKNNHTRISRLFTPLPSNEDDGSLRGIFERMLLLTATPFELSHAELINVLRRLEGIVPRRLQPTQTLDERLTLLKERLQRAQETAIALDESWSRLGASDVSVFDSWGVDNEPPDDSMSVAARRAWRDAQLAVRARHAMHEQLRRWVIRHERPHRRRYLAGAAILPGQRSAAADGIEIAESDALPFLLAARAQAVATDTHGAARPHFAYGIASSYDAYLRLDRAENPIDSDTELDPDSAAPEPRPPADDATRWYRDEITRLLTFDRRREAHPKIVATVNRAAELWSTGQKCLIFCWYIRTTAVLQEALRRRIDALIAERAARLLNVNPADADAALENLARRLLGSDTTSHATIRGDLYQKFQGAAGRSDIADALADVAIRNLRTGSFLVRYTNLTPGLDDKGLLRDIAGDNATGVDLLARWTGFARRMAAMTNDERTKVLAQLLGELPNEDDSGRRGASLSTVRRAYGQTRREDRERLISVFNTPFAPDILVASSVMGEGIDLHHECRHVIHHDLDWNPSRLEQRTGRLDRIGALAEREHMPIEVYEPYLAGTHDEKMFRVVKDRAGWFDIVMGRAVASDESRTDAEETRVPLHPRIREALSMDLRSWSNPSEAD